MLWLIVGLAVVIPMGWLAGKQIQFNTELLSVFNPHLPEIQGRRLYQRFFLQDHDVVIGLEASSATEATEAVFSLAQHLESTFPELQGKIESRYPWEEDLASSGELVAYIWANSTRNDLRRLAVRLSPGNVASALERHRNGSASSSRSELEQKWRSIDPLELALVPGFDAPPSQPSGQLALRSPDGALRLVLIDVPAQRFEGPALRQWTEDLAAAISAWQAEQDGGDILEVTQCGWASYLTEIRSQMSREFFLSLLTTGVGVMMLVFLAYRNLTPLLFLLLTLASALLLTVHLALWLFGGLNAISVGFAPILIALVVDYTIIVLQERSQPHSGDTRTSLLKPITWAALTTAIVFVGLNLSAVPGLAQFGTLVALGIVLGALLSLTFFNLSIKTLNLRPPATAPRRFGLSSDANSVATILAAFLAAGILFGGGIPQFDLDPENLKARPTEAHQKLQALNRKVSPSPTPTETVLFLGRTSGEVDEAMERWSAKLQENCPEAELLSPALLWPQPDRIEEHRTTLRLLLSKREQVLASFDAENENEAISFLKQAFDYWDRYVTSDEVPLPSGAVASWALRQSIRQETEGWFAAKALVQWPDQPDDADIDSLRATTEGDPSVVLLNWKHMRPVFDAILVHDIRYVLYPLMALLVFILFGAFRSWRDTTLAVIAISSSAALMLAAMNLFGIRWSQINFIAIPLVVGVGLDYSIHITFALRRTNGDLELVRATLGKALFVCAGSSIIGFSSLNWSANPGLSSLGQICALGVASAFFTAVVLLPGWWIAWHRRT